MDLYFDININSIALHVPKFSEAKDSFRCGIFHTSVALAMYLVNPHISVENSLERYACTKKSTLFTEA